MVILTVILAANVFAVRKYSFAETPVAFAPLRLLDAQLSGWRLEQTLAIEPETLAYLRPDDHLYRVYRRGETAASVYIAYFQSQRNGLYPHSPKHCLPGSGWMVSNATVQTYDKLDPETLLETREMVVEKGASKALVLYWYQNSRRAFASEITGKLHLLPDLLRHGRSDITLVRLMIPYAEGGEPTARREARELASALFPRLCRHFREAAVAHPVS